MRFLCLFSNFFVRDGCRTFMSVKVGWVYQNDPKPPRVKVESVSIGCMAHEKHLYP